MMTKLKRAIFGKDSEPAAITALRQIEATNKADKEWGDGFSQRANALRDALRIAQERLEKTPSEEAAAEFMAALEASAQADRLSAVHRVVFPQLQRTRIKRTIEPLKAALAELQETFKAKRLEVKRKEAQLAEEIGILEDGGESPVCRLLLEKANEAEKHLARLKEIDPDLEDPVTSRLTSIVAFALED